MNDIPLVMSFIDEHWRKNDVLAVSRQFFEWNFVWNGVVTIIIGIDDDEKKVYGIMGYLPYTVDDEYPDCAGTIWKAIRCEDPLLGIHLADYMYENVQLHYYAGAGMRKRSRRVAELNGGTVVSMDHYYRLNRNYLKEDFRIALIDEVSVPKAQDSKAELIKIQDIDDFRTVIDESILLNSVFRKDYKYINKRYFGHPIYEYDLWRIQGADCTNAAVMVTRTEHYMQSSICKIIDFFGDFSIFAIIGSALDKLMDEKGYEFVDVYSYGVNTDYYVAGGMIRCDSTSRNIIPNYFQPFEQKNIELYLEKPYFDGLVLFRGDGDQDRPVLFQ